MQILISEKGNDHKYVARNSPEVGGKHLTTSQVSASGTHQEIPELCNPSNNIVQAHLYSWPPVQRDFNADSTDG